MKYEKSDEYIRTRIEPFLHVFPVVVSLFNAILNLAKKTINIYRSGTCSYGINQPPHCTGYDDGSVVMEGLFDIPCGRGRDFFTTSFIISTTLVLFPALIIVISLTMIYRSVKRLENKTAKYGVGTLCNLINENDESPPRGICLRLKKSTIAKKVQAFVRYMCLAERASQNKESDYSRSVLYMRSITQQKKKSKNSRSILYKGVAYSFSLFVTWASYLPAVFLTYFSAAKMPILLVYVTIIFNPLQGVYNLSIYMQPRVLSAKKSKKDNLSWWQAFVKAFWSKGGEKKTGRLSSIRSSASSLRNRNKTKYSNNSVNSSVPREPKNNILQSQVPQDVTHLSFGNYRSSSTFNDGDNKEEGDSRTTPPVAFHDIALKDPLSSNVCLDIDASIDDGEPQITSSSDPNGRDELNIVVPGSSSSERRTTEVCSAEYVPITGGNDEENTIYRICDHIDNENEKKVTDNSFNSAM